MKLGFTGTRDGLTHLQWEAVYDLLTEHKRTITEFHHGDCVGADEEAHGIAITLGIEKIIVHPPDNDNLRAFCQGHIILHPLPYLIRDRNIVNQSDLILGTPATKYKLPRSGTWTTMSYASSVGKLWKVVFPDGIVVDG